MAKLDFLPVLTGTLIPVKCFKPHVPPAYELFCYDRDADGNVAYRSDVTLFMQERSMFQKLGKDSYIEVLNSLLPQGGSNIRKYCKNISDDELFQTIKPRNCQTPSELRTWSSYLDEVLRSHDELLNPVDDEKDSNVDVSGTDSVSDNG